MFIDTKASGDTSKLSAPESGSAIIFPSSFFSILLSINYVNLPSLVSNTPLLTDPFSVIVLVTLYPTLAYSFSFALCKNSAATLKASLP